MVVAQREGELGKVLVALRDQPTKSLTRTVLAALSAKDRESAEATVTAVVQSSLPTVARPFTFGGKVTHELILEPGKLASFSKRERIGAVVSAFIIASLQDLSQRPISNEAPS
jgi:hypothetical protein